MMKHKLIPLMIVALVLAALVHPAIVVGQAGGNNVFLPSVTNEVGNASTANAEVIPIPVLPCRVEGWGSRIFCFFLNLVTLQSGTGSAPSTPTSTPAPTPTPLNLVLVTSEGNYLEVTDDCPAVENHNCAVWVQFKDITGDNCPEPKSVGIKFKDAYRNPVDHKLDRNYFWAKVFPPPNDGDRYNYTKYEASVDCIVP
jgi:hypothetical protein